MNQVVFHPRRARGFSMIELLIALAITSALLTATAVAIDASFKSYASASELASAQAGTRMVVHRLLTLVRTSTAHGPLEPDAAATPPVTIDGSTIESNFLEMIDQTGRLLRVEYRAADEELWVLIDDDGDLAFEMGETQQPLLSGVTDASFFARRRMDQTGVWVLERGSLDITVQPGRDNTLAIENGNNQPIRIVASTMPRRLE